MANKIFLFLCLMAAAFFSTSGAAAQTVGEGTIPAGSSKLAQINLPPEARRVKDGMAPAEVSEVLQKLVAQGGAVVRQGDSEVLLWGGDFQKSKGTRMMEKIENDLKNAGWEYELGVREQGATIFTLLRENPSRRGLVGFFYPSKDAFIFALTEMLPAVSAAVDSPAEESGEKPQVSPKNSDEVAPVSESGRGKLVGKWFRSTKKDISGLSGYTDATFEFYADGTMQSFVEDQSLTPAMCSVTEVSKISGTYTVAGDRLTMNLSAGTTIGKSSCGSSGDFKKRLSASSVTKTFVVKTMDSPFRPDSPAMLCLDGAPDNKCFERVLER